MLFCRLVGDGMTTHWVRNLIAALAILALLAANCYAQNRPVQPSELQKADAAKKKADERATDEAYKATIKRTPDAPKLDPWGLVRTPPTTSGK